MFFVSLNWICLGFMQIHTYFYINYVIYSGLLIFCLKEQFLIEFSTRKITGKGVHFRCSYAYVHVFKGSDTSAADRRALWPRSSLPHTEATPPTWLHQQDSCHARHTCKKANLHKADWPFRARWACLDVKKILFYFSCLYYVSQSLRKVMAHTYK